mmetsp:Transcript_7166/g.19911  ORF Transcript_7166/g.19911 Transcript_7166/m.19911 type:complete len:331 (-) Transcript_7166:55-1047(-)
MPDRPTGRSRFVDTLRGVAEKHGFGFRTFSRDWIIQILDSASKRQCSVFGYTFDINPAGAVEICKEKAATSLVLDGHGVPNIPHSVFLSPSNPFTAEYVPRTGIWAEIQALVGHLGFPVVLKPLKGTGGLGVMKATCWKEVEAAVQHLYSRDYGIAVSPYKRIIDEYRCVCLDGVMELVYRKVRSCVPGDGSRSVTSLLAARLQATGPKEAASLVAAAAALSAEELARVPAEGEAVPLQWKHNLGQGASADLEVPAEMRAKLAPMAVKAAIAIGIRFCSVDIVEVEAEGLMVMEVNSGVMMDSLMGQLGEVGVALASRLYETAVLRALGQ